MSLFVNWNLTFNVALEIVASYSLSGPTAQVSTIILGSIFTRSSAFIHGVDAYISYITNANSIISRHAVYICIIIII